MGMHLDHHAQRPTKPGSCTPHLDPPHTCDFSLASSPRCDREQPCSRALSSFPLGTLKNPRYPCNFRCNVYLAERKGGARKKASVTNSLRVNMCRRGFVR
ncbi:hypothetical protein ILYODFUR_019911 [Ilyodon furcidens]|uniref:Uncharacterized protein n=2 Tax=Goodeidae TaxID=28758 RepID=A0ABV0SND6_9TELE